MAYKICIFILEEYYQFTIINWIMEKSYDAWEPIWERRTCI